MFLLPGLSVVCLFSLFSSFFHFPFSQLLLPMPIPFQRDSAPVGVTLTMVILPAGKILGSGGFMILFGPFLLFRMV